MTKRFSQADWISLGLKTLAEEGPPGVTIDALCARANKTKGSFYSHFSTVGEFTKKLAETWREQNTEKLIAQAGQSRSALDAQALELDHSLEREMRRLAAVDEAVASISAEVDARRIDFLAALYRSRFDEADSLALARMEYGLFVMYQTGVGGTEGEFADSYQRFLRIVGM